MPTYEYLCESCGYTFKKFQNMSDEPLKKCPQCGEKVQRLIGTGMGVIFKGKGFYSTDYSRQPTGGKTCCGRDEPCAQPPCSDNGVCKR